MRPAPRYWWDFEHTDDTVTAVIVQSDYPNNDCLARIPIVGDNGDHAISVADKWIADFKAGRKTPQWEKS